MVFPIVLGSGKRLFGDGSLHTVLRLVDTKPVGPDGVVILPTDRSDRTQQAARRPGDLSGRVRRSAARPDLLLIRLLRRLDM